MKKRISIFSIATLLLTFTSCEDWLDMPSDVQFDSSTIFESVDRAEMALMGAYASTFNLELLYQFAMGTDELFSTESNSKSRFANYEYVVSEVPSSTYTSMYKSIEYANVCIKGLNEMTASDESEQKQIDAMIGEAYAIRAMCYLNIVRFFGDVPYSTVPVADLGTFVSSRVSRDTIYDGCIADLQKAVELIPWKSAGMVSTTERFTKNAAYGMLARVALYAAGYSLRFDLETYAESSLQLSQRSDAARIKELYKIAADACKAVISQNENSLLSSYEQVFRDLAEGAYNQETMYEFALYGANSSDVRNGYTNGMFCHTNSMFMKAEPQMAAMPNYYYAFEEADLRRDVTIANYGITDENIRQMNPYGHLTIGKFRVNWKSEVGTAASRRDINVPLLRYSDVLLMYAEALNEYNGSPTAEAIAAYEEVRTRGFGGDRSLIGTTPTTYQDFRDAIIEERRLELGFEHLRRTDLVRWGIAYEKLTEAKQDLIDMANRSGNYTDIDCYRAYLPEEATTFNDPVVAVEFISYKAEPDAAEKARLEQEGYVLVNMFDTGAGTSGTNGDRVFSQDAAWIEGLFAGLRKNRTELVPLNTTMMDENPGLVGQQHPAY